MTVIEWLSKFVNSKWNLCAYSKHNDYTLVIQSIRSIDGVKETLDFCDRNKIEIAVSDVAEYRRFEIHKDTDETITFAHTHIDVSSYNDTETSVYDIVNTFLNDTRANLVKRRQELESETESND